MTPDFNLLDLLQRHPIYLSDFIIQIYLVLHDFRPACLLERANIAQLCKTPDAAMQKMIRLAHKHGLHSAIENTEFQRFLIYKTAPKTPTADLTEPQLGKLLGFRCYSHLNWHDTSIPRIAIHLQGSYLRKYTFAISHVCECSKITNGQINTYIKTKLRKLKSILPTEFKINSEITKMPIE